MLTKCPECELQVSDKAATCPHCGYPLKYQSAKPKEKSKKHMRLPNGFGQITKISGQNLRNRYRAMVTVGKDDNGRPIAKLLKPQAYFATYNEAYEALVEYNRNPYDLEDDITVGQLYTKWSEAYFRTLTSDSSIRTVTAAWAYCSSVKNIRAKDLRARHIKAVLDEGTNSDGKYPSAGTKSRIKSVFNLMLDYAVEYEIVDRNYSRTFDLSEEVVKESEKAKKEHLAFSSDEMQKLWNCCGKVPFVDAVLIQCYTGFRPGELCELKCENISLSEQTIVGGMKTEAGTDRKVPIHPRIRKLVENRMGGEYLIGLSYGKYQRQFKKIMESLGLNPEHRAHDPRKQFVTMAKEAGVDEYAIKKLVGHKISDITEAVYTQRSFDWLRSELEKIK